MKLICLIETFHSDIVISTAPTSARTSNKKRRIIAFVTSSKHAVSVNNNAFETGTPDVNQRRKLSLGRIQPYYLESLQIR